MHDFIHCAVEGAAGLESGFWGRLASSYAGVGFSLAQDQSSGSTTARVTPTGKSLTVSFTGSTSAPLRVQLSDGSTNWCCNITASPVTIPYGSFNTRCFDATPDGTAYAKQAITALQLTVPGGAAAQPYNISLTSVTENPF